MSERFGNASIAEITEKRLNIHAKSTLKANQKAVRALREYCKSKNMSTTVEKYSKSELNNLLCTFYIDARKTNGEKYKASNLENIRFSLNRFFQNEKNYTMDIVKDPEFRDANVSFRAAMTELKREGKGNTEHHPVIPEAHLSLIYNSALFEPITPSRLQNKVQFDIRFYFARRGAENMHSMTKNTFVLRRDPDTNKEFIRKYEDEMSKNHRAGDKESSSGIMPENPDSPLCPVKSFKLYFSKLHPGCDSLWQRPRDSFFRWG